MGSPIVTRIVDLWRRPPSPPATGYSRNDLKARDVWSGLRRDFDGGAIRTAVIEHLRETGEATWTGARLDGRQVFVAGCCFDLVNAIDELHLDAVTTSILVRTLGSTAAYWHLGPSVRRHMDLARLLETLATGARTAPADLARAECLAGLALYAPSVQRPSPAEALAHGAELFDAEIRRAQSGTNDLVREGVASARMAMWRIRSANPALRRASPDDYRARGAGEIDRAELVVERADDSTSAIEIAKMASHDRSMRIEYRCLDPALLPDDAPLVIEDAFLRRHAPGRYAGAIDDVTYAHLVDHLPRSGRGWERVATRPLPAGRREFLVYPNAEHVKALPRDELRPYILDRLTEQERLNAPDLERCFGLGQLAGLLKVDDLEPALEGWLADHPTPNGHDAVALLLQSYWTKRVAVSPNLVRGLASALPLLLAVAAPRDSLVLALAVALPKADFALGEDIRKGFAEVRPLFGSLQPAVQQALVAAGCGPGG